MRDPLEDSLLEELEEHAQKTAVLTRWADDMYEYVKAVPQSTSLFRSDLFYTRLTHPSSISDRAARFYCKICEKRWRIGESYGTAEDS